VKADVAFVHASVGRAQVRRVQRVDLAQTDRRYHRDNCHMKLQNRGSGLPYVVELLQECDEAKNVVARIGGEAVALAVYHTAVRQYFPRGVVLRRGAEVLAVPISADSRAAALPPQPSDQ
jgi:hypothetical protein